MTVVPPAGGGAGVTVSDALLATPAVIHVFLVSASFKAARRLTNLCFGSRNKAIVGVLQIQELGIPEAWASTGRSTIRKPIADA
jgi:hypothetical protein